MNAQGPCVDMRAHMHAQAHALAPMNAHAHVCTSVRTGSPHHYYRQPTPLLQAAIRTGMGHKRDSSSSPVHASRHIVMAMVIAYVAMAVVVMAYVVMALYGYGLYSHGLHSCGRCSFGLCDLDLF